MQTLILDSTSASIQVAMSTSAATTNPTYTVAYADNNGTTFTEGANRGALSGSTDVTVVGNPSSGYRRVVKDITIYNGDSAAVTIFIKYDVSATQRTIAKLVLAVGDTWNFSGTYDSNGNLKTVAGTVNLATQVTGTLPVANGGTGATTASAARTNLAAVGAGDANTFSNTNTFTGQALFTGTSAILSSKFTNGLEKVTVSATAATGTINYDVTTQSVLYYTSNASANWTVNFRASSGTSLDTAMSTGEVITVVFLVQQGSTAYYNNAVQIDGSSVTPVYDGQVAWTSGNANALDAYTYTIIKTGSATFKVLALQSAFA